MAVYRNSFAEQTYEGSEAVRIVSSMLKKVFLIKNICGILTNKYVTVKNFREGACSI